MLLSKDVLLFPGKIPKDTEKFLWFSPPQLIFTLPDLVMEGMVSFLNGDLENMDIFGEEINYLISHPVLTGHEIVTHILENIGFLKEEGNRTIVLAPEDVAYEVHKQIDSYLHIPEEGDKDYFIDFSIEPESKLLFPKGLHLINDSQKICLQ